MTISNISPHKISATSTSDAVLHALAGIATQQVNAQIAAFSDRLAAAMLDASKLIAIPREASMTYHSAQLLRNSSSAFFYAAGTELESIFSQELLALKPKNKRRLIEQLHQDVALSLVSYEEMDNRLTLSRISRGLEFSSAEQLSALNIRLAYVLRLDVMSTSQNPFRPDVFLRAMHAAWRQFSLESASHNVILPLLNSDVLFDLNVIYRALNDALIQGGVVSNLQDAYRVRKTAEDEAAAAAQQEAVSQRLKDIFSGQETLVEGAPQGAQPVGPGTFAGFPTLNNFAIEQLGLPVPQASDSALFQHLTQLQNMMAAAQSAAPNLAPSSVAASNVATSELSDVGAASLPAIDGINDDANAPGDSATASVAGASAVGANNASISTDNTAANNAGAAAQNDPLPQLIQLQQLQQLEQSLSALAGSSTEQNTLHLIAKIFDSVFTNPNIPAPIKNLISELQVPVLKAALVDQEFFFEESHPARRMIELLTQYSVAWDEARGVSDPLFQTMRQSVRQIQEEFGEKLPVFQDAVANIERAVKEEDEKVQAALDNQITRALKKEQLKLARAAAQTDIATRIGTGEVAAVIEHFLEKKWAKVLTAAYSVKDEKPHAVTDALKTMDDLLWSVKPKITQDQRQELLTRLPTIIARLNKWLAVVNWDDKDRDQFFADLAECHASIVRAPIEMSPEKQIEIAIKVAQKSAERRKKKQELVDAHAAEFMATRPSYWDNIDALQRGTWLDWTLRTGTFNRVKLIWISPMRNLFIFTTSHKEQSFSIAVEDLVKAFGEQRIKVIEVDNVVDRVLIDALDVRLTEPLATVAA